MEKINTCTPSKIIEACNDLVKVNYIASSRFKELVSILNFDFQMDYFYNDSDLEFLLQRAVVFLNHLESNGLVDGDLYMEVKELIKKFKNYGYAV